MTTLGDWINDPSAHDRTVAAFNIFARLVANEPHGNPYQLAALAIKHSEAFFEVARDLRGKA